MKLGVELMIMGMGTVFAFLILLIFSMNMMSKIVTMLESDRIETDNKKVPDNTLLAVISAAIHQHRHRG